MEIHRKRLTLDEVEAEEQASVTRYSKWSYELPPCSGWWDVIAVPGEEAQRCYFVRDPTTQDGLWCRLIDNRTVAVGTWSQHKNTLQWRGLARPAAIPPETPRVRIPAHLI